MSNISHSDLTIFNNLNPFIPTGIGAPVGNGTGVIPFDMPTDYKTPVLQTQVPVWRGVANVFGYLWRWVDGVLFDIQSGGGVSQVFTTYDPLKFSSDSFSAYEFRGLAPRSTGVIKEILFDQWGGFVPSVAVGASTVTYFSDNFYTNIPASGNALRGCMVGGASYYSSLSGLSCINSETSPVALAPFIGSRLCYYPEH